ncbi:MAG: pyridoxal phosphate-dependent aminotransferase [Planctomycetota bacterium]
MRFPPLASAVDSIEPENAYVVLARAQVLERAGRDIIHLEIGEPDFQTDTRIARAGIEAIETGKTRYTPTPGIKPLCQAIASDISIRCQREVLPSEVVVGPGAKPILFLASLAVIEPGDEVIYPDPGFPTYQSMVGIAKGKGVPIRLMERDGFAFDLDQLRDRINERTKLIVLNSPSNPTGGVLSRSDLEQIAELARRFNCWIISDEIYSRMCFDASYAPTIAALDGMAERTVIVDGFSKTHAMTGWRLGFGVMPSRLAEKVSLLAVHAFGCTAQFTQFAGLEAITGSQDHVQQAMSEYRLRRDTLVNGLNSIDGIDCRSPAGTFYAFPNIRSFGRTSESLANQLLEEAGVAVLPGTAFGCNGEGYLRICFANSVENIQRAVERIKNTLI